MNKKPKLVPLPKLQKKAWKAFATWVRFRGHDGLGSNTCISCQKLYPIKTLNAGHYIHGKWTKKSGLDERNVWCQCIYCNLGLGGNQVEYKIELLKKIGQDGIDEITQLSKQIWKPSREELEGIIEKYK